MLDAITKNGKKVWLAFNPDCEDNEGGWFVQVYFDEYGDYQDYFCVHPDDCDCKDENAVEEYAKKFIANEEYDFETPKNELRWFDTEYLRADETIQPVAVNGTLYYTLFDRHGYNYVFPSVWALMEYLKEGKATYDGCYETEEDMVESLETM